MNGMGGFFDWLGGGSGSSGTDADKTPAKAVNFIDLWTQVKRIMINDLGIYKLESGAAATYEGSIAPQLTKQEGYALYKAWFEVGSKLATKMSGAALSTVVDAHARLMSDYYDWEDWCGTTCPSDPALAYHGKYMYLPATKRLLDLITRAVIGYNAAIWASYNIESDYERALWAIDSAPGGGAIKWAFQLGWKVASGELSGIILDAMKNMVPSLPRIPIPPGWMLWGGAAFSVYWFLLRKK